MNNIFFFIKHILGRNSSHLVFFIVFDLFPKRDLLHFRDSICNSLFLNNNKKIILKNIFFQAASCRYKLKRMVHYYRRKKSKIADITMDLYKNPLDTLSAIYKFSIIQNNTKFIFRLTDLLTMWKTALMHSDGLFPKPLSLKNPYTGDSFKNNTLYNIYFALLHSSFHIPPLISQLFLLNFNINDFKIIHGALLQDIAIHNYYDDISEDEKFIDILEMLDNYANKDHNLDSDCSEKIKKYIIKKIGNFLLSYYYIEYSNNLLLKAREKKTLIKKINLFLSENPKIPLSY